MSAAEACQGHFFPKKCFGKRVLRECRSRKKDNVVLIEVDSDDFGDVIILDVPESFHKKFRKKPKHVISIDDDDDDDNAGESKSEACDANGDATTSGKYSPSNSVDVDLDSVHERNTPLKLSKSKRTYSGKIHPRNRYGLGSDDDNSSDNDCSDCEFVGESFGGLKDQWNKPSFKQPHDRSFDFPENKSGSYEPAYNKTEEDIFENLNIFENLKPPGQQSNLSNLDTDDAFPDFAEKLAEDNQFFQQGFEHSEMSEQFKTKQDSCTDNFDSNDKYDPSAPHNPVYQSGRPNTAVFSEPSSSGRCLNHKIKEPSNDSTKELPRQVDSSRQDDDPMEIDEVFIGEDFENINKSGHLNGETSCPVSPERDPGAEQPCTSSVHDSCCANNAHDNRVNSSNDQSRIIIDRQKLKETDEYKRIMEEEWASRRQQLQLQAEEARRLRNRKKAENMRIKANERRQMERLEEVRETRRKDEESSNLKDKLRAVIRNELRQLERTCGDMSSLLRCLGIPVGGLYPSPKEIQAAYKRACLKFHPDRYAKSDLRQQVEAEEKFKLISNMKDKLLLK